MELSVNNIKKNSIECRDCINGISILDNNSIDLVVTAPPIYDKSMEKDETYDSYLEFLDVTFFVLYEKVVSGGYLAIVVPQSVETDSLRQPLFSHIMQIMEKHNFLYNTEILWDKKEREYILIYQKDKVSESIPQKTWRVPTVGKKSGVIPFPVMLSDSLIDIYSKEGDLVLDPFIGTGTTAISCLKSNRNYIGFDNNKELVELANKLVEKYSYNQVSE